MGRDGEEGDEVMTEEMAERTLTSVAERLRQVCVRLGAGRPTVYDFDCIEWED